MMRMLTNAMLKLVDRHLRNCSRLKLRLIPGMHPATQVTDDALKPYAGETLDKTLGLLDKALSVAAAKDVSAQVTQRLAFGARRDMPLDTPAPQAY